MHGKLLPGLALLISVLPVVGEPAAKTVYFPAELHIPSISCQWGKDKIAILSDFEDNWFSAHLTAAQEPSLFEKSRKSQDGSNSYRLTVLPSFTAPVFVRIEENARNEMTLTAKVLSGKGGYGPGVIAKELHRQLTSAEREAVHRLFAASSFVDFRDDPCGRGLDGSEWIVETRLGSGYRYAHQWSPSKGPIRQVGMALLSLAGLR